MLWDGEDLPFTVIEVGYADNGKKTRGRSIHWLAQGAGKLGRSKLRLASKSKLLIILCSRLKSIRINGHLKHSMTSPLLTRFIDECFIWKSWLLSLLLCSPDYLGVSNWHQYEIDDSK